jgi:hypothetical protein
MKKQKSEVNNFGYSIDYKFVPQKKRSLRENLEELLELARENERQDLIDFLKDRLFLLDKRNEISRRKNAESAEIDKLIMDKIMAVLMTKDYEGAGLRPCEIKEYAKLDYTIQKITAMCYLLVKAGRAEKVPDISEARFRRFESLETYLKRCKEERENKFRT